MNITVFEAAARYDLAQRPAHPERRCLVFDLGRCAAGCCTCGGDGNVTLTAQWAAPDARDVWDDCAARLARAAGAAEDAGAALAGQLAEFNRAVRNYLLSDRTLDAAAYRAGERELTCSEALAALGPVLADVGALAEQAAGADPGGEAVVILTGRAAAVWAVGHAVRERLSADPLLPDARFVNGEYPDAPEAIAALGEELYRRERLVGRDLALIALDESGAERDIPLASKEQDRDALRTPAYVGPLYIARGDALRVRVDGGERALALPYPLSPAEDGDLIDVAAGLGGDGADVVVRRCLFPTRVYHIGLA